jgi:hypothetical protein
MEKKVLSEIALYIGEVKMPKYFDINRPELKADILSSFINQKTISQNNMDYSFLDYEVPFSKSLDMLHTYVRDNFLLKHKRNLILKKSFGNILNINEQSFSRSLVDPLDLKNSPDFVMVYGVDVQPNSSTVVIEYDDNRRANRTWHVPIENNKFVIFTSNQKFFISQNISQEQNIFLTTTFDYI